MGAGIYSFAQPQWGNAELFSRLLGSLMGGFVLLVFIAPITGAVGIVTYGFCWVVTQMGVLTPTWLWTLAGGAFGAAYALVWANYFVHGQQLLLVTSGTIIGFATGVVLAFLWKREKPARNL